MYINCAGSISILLTGHEDTRRQGVDRIIIVLIRCVVVVWFGCCTIFAGDLVSKRQTAVSDDFILLNSVFEISCHVFTSSYSGSLRMLGPVGGAGSDA